MKIESVEHHLQDGTTITLRNLEPKDAALAVPYMSVMYASSPFLAREVEEWNITLEDEKVWLEKALQDPKRLMLGSFLQDELVGLCDFSPISSQKRMAHRAQCALSVAPPFQGKGIGSAMMQVLLETAKTVGFAQMELEVVSINQKAIALYKKFHFTKCGIIERGMRYKDGSFVDLDIMMLKLI